MSKEDLERILKCAVNVYRNLGPGHSESVYQKALLVDLNEHKVSSVPETDITIKYKGETVGHVRADLIVQKCIVVELKTQVSELKEENLSQLHHYLVHGDFHYGILINFPKRFLSYIEAITLSRRDKIDTQFLYKQRRIQVFSDTEVTPFQFIKEQSASLSSTA